MNPNVIPIIWVGFIGAVPLLLFVGTQNPAVLGAIVSFVVLAVVVAIYWRRPSSRAVAATTTRHDAVRAAVVCCGHSRPPALYRRTLTRPAAGPTRTRSCLCVTAGGQPEIRAVDRHRRLRGGKPELVQTA